MVKKCMSYKVACVRGENDVELLGGVDEQVVETTVLQINFSNLILNRFGLWNNLTGDAK